MRSLSNAELTTAAATLKFLPASESSVSGSSSKQRAAVNRALPGRPLRIYGCFANPLRPSTVFSPRRSSLPKPASNLPSKTSATLILRATAGSASIPSTFAARDAANRFTEKRDLRTLYSPRAESVLRVLLGRSQALLEGSGIGHRRRRQLGVGLKRQRFAGGARMAGVRRGRHEARPTSKTSR
jgi:hypothetical protein